MTRAQQSLLKAQAEAAFKHAVAAYKTDDLHSAVAHWRRACAAYEELINGGATQYRPNRAMMLMNWGIALGRKGDFDKAVQQYQAAKVAYDELIQGGDIRFRPYRAKALMNWGNAHYAKGDFEQAVRGFAAAKSAYDEIVARDATQCRSDRAMALRMWGLALYSKGDLEDALKQFASAISAYDELINWGASEYSGYRAMTLMECGVVLDSKREPLAAVLKFACAKSAFDDLINCGETQYVFHRAQTLMNWGAAECSIGDLGAAVRKFSIVDRTYAELLHSGAMEYLADHATNFANWGTALCLIGDLDNAVQKYASAKTIYDGLINSGATWFDSDRANVLLNWGVTLYKTGDFTNAIQNYAAAKRIYDELIAGGAARYRPVRAKTLMNWGNALNSEGRHDDAARQHAAAYSAYDELISSGATEYRPDRAKTLMNWGVCLRRKGDLAGAVERFAHAQRAYDEIINSGGTQCRSERADTLVNWGNALSAFGLLGDFDDALQKFATAENIYSELIDSGALQHRPVRAMTLANWGATLVSVGALDAAAQKFSQSLTTYSDLLHELHGRQWQFGDDAATVTEMLLQTLIADERAMRGKESIENAQLVHRSHSLVTVLLRRLLGSEPVLRLLPRLRRCMQWIESIELGELHEAQVARWQCFRAQLVSELTLALPRLLRDSHPTILREKQTEVAALVEQVRVWVVRCANEAPDMGERLPVEWLLKTKGLRAMRAALADSVDPALRELENLYREFDRLSEQIGGASSLISNCVDGSDGGRVSMITLASEGERNYDALLARLAKLEADIARNALSLRNAGKLPVDFGMNHVLDCAAIAERLRSGQAWIGMVRLENPGRLMLAVIARPALTGEHEVPKPVVFWREEPLPFAALADCGSALAAAHTEMKGVRGGTFRYGPASLVIAATEGSAAALPQRSLAEAMTGLHGVVAPVAQLIADDLAKLGVMQIDITPTGDLHLLPWVQVLWELGATRSGAVRVYPSAVDWWRAHAPQQAFQPNQQAEAAPEATLPEQAVRWACLGYGVDDLEMSPSYLPFAALEMELARRIWLPHGANAMHRLRRDAPQWPELEQQSSDANFISSASAKMPINALLGVGHGATPNNNMARAGLRIGTDHSHIIGQPPNDKVFSAHDLPNLKHAKRLVLSCCTMARTEEVFGEALGMAATAFAYQTRWAMGYLIPVGDLEATLFSAALQHGLSQLTPDRYAQDSAWRETFEHTRTEILAGRWPEGFAAFVTAELADALMQAMPSKEHARWHWAQYRDALYSNRAQLGLDERTKLSVSGDWAQPLASFSERIALAPPPTLRAMMPWVICLGG